jgi:hypothetical protein
MTRYTASLAPRRCHAAVRLDQSASVVVLRPPSPDGAPPRPGASPTSGGLTVRVIGRVLCGRRQRGGHGLVLELDLCYFDR